MPLKPFPIYDLRSGLKLDRKPWLTPVQAWTKLENALPLRGRIVKRPGTRVFGDLAIAGDFRTLTGSAGQTHVTSAAHGGALGPIARVPQPQFADFTGGYIYGDTNGRVRQRLLYGAADPEWNTTTGNIAFGLNLGETVATGTLRATDSAGPQQITFGSTIAGDFDASFPTTFDLHSGVFVFKFAAPLVGSLVVEFEGRRIVNAGEGHAFVTKLDATGYKWQIDVPGRILGSTRRRTTLYYDMRVTGPAGVVRFEYPSGIPTDPGTAASTIDPVMGVATVEFPEPGLLSFSCVYYETIQVTQGDPRIVAGGNLTWMFKGPGPILPGYFIAKATGGTPTITFDVDGVVSGAFDPAGPNWISYETGEVVVTFLADPGANPTIEAWFDVGSIDYDTGEFDWTLYETSAADWTCIPYERPLSVSGGVATENAVMGIINFFPEAGGEYLFAFDRRRLWSWNGTRFVEKFGVDFWEAEPNDFFWFVPARLRADAGKNVMLIANRKHFLTYFDGSTLHEVHTDWRTSPFIGASLIPPDPLTGTGGSPDYERQIDTADIALMHPRNRIILLGTTESGTYFGRRARWSEVNPYVDYTPGGVAGDQQWFASEYDDAQTEDTIASAGFLGDDLYVWFRGKASGGGSLWRIVWQDDYRRPFYWEFLSSFDGGYAPKSTMEIQGTVLATMSATQFIGTDGRSVQPIDTDIPDFLVRAAPDALDMAFAAKATELRSIFETIPLGDSDYPDRIMVFQYEDKAWALWNFAAHCFGPYRFTGVPEAWDDVLGTWEQDRIFDEVTQRAGYPTLLIGDRDLRIHTLYGGRDDEIAGPIVATATTGELNPYRDDMIAARLAQIDFVMEPQPGAEIVVTLRGGFKTIPYAVYHLDLSPAESDATQVKRTIIVNQSSSFHTIEVSNFEAIDAVIPWFEEDGDIREVG